MCFDQSYQGLKPDTPYSQKLHKIDPETINICLRSKC